MLLALQLVPIPAAAASASSQSAQVREPATLSQSMVLRWNSYQGFEVDSFSTNTTVQYVASADAPVSLALMTASQYYAWQNDLTDPISNSITYQNGTGFQNSVPIAPGRYFLVFYAYYSRAQVLFGFQVYPSTPYSYGPLSPPLASGISSFGIANDSGTVTAYEVQTSQIVGAASISALQVSTPDAFRYGVRTTGATVQLNAMLVVNDNGSSLPKVYWVQNVPDFVTGASQVSMGDEIWNNTDTAGFLSNQTITSTNFQNGGFVYPSGIGRHRTGPNLYAYSMNNMTYAMPFGSALMMKATASPGTGVLVQLGYRLLANGSALSAPTDWYDNVTIHDPSVGSAYNTV